jgi:hypothetical protein
MSKEQFYFSNKDSEVCYTRRKFDFYMEERGLSEIEVYKAEKYKSTDVFWCQVECFCGDDSQDTCGKQCSSYEPRNGKSGCCRHYSKYLYEKGEKVILTKQYIKD